VPVDVLTCEQLYVSERRPLLALGWMLLGSAADAEDAYQECFAKVSQGALDAAREPRAYVRTMMQNECLAIVRKRKRDVLTADAPAVVHHDPEVDAFAASLARLTPRRRAAVVLRYYCDLSLEEVGAALGCRPSSASSLIRRGLTDLEELL
jgi:RNA polymerase sigma factor (sigma-70 family)